MADTRERQDGRGYMLYDLDQDPDEQHNTDRTRTAARALEQSSAWTRFLVRLAASTYVIDSVNL